MTNVEENDEEFCTWKSGLKSLRGNLQKFDECISCEKKKGKPSDEHTIESMIVLLSQESNSNIPEILGFDMLQVFSQTQSGLRTIMETEQQHMIEVVDVNALQHEANIAREAKHRFYKAKSRQVKASAAVADSQRLQQVLDEERASRNNCTYVRQEAVHAMMQVQEESDLFVMKKTMEILQLQLNSKKQQVELLETSMNQLAEHMSIVAEQEEQQKQHQAQRKLEMEILGPVQIDHLDACFNGVELPAMICLEGEGIVFRANKIVVLSHTRPTPGNFVITNYRIHFSLPCTLSTELKYSPDYCEVLYDFQGQCEEELSLQRGTRVRAAEFHDDGWVTVELLTDPLVTGIVPYTHLKKEVECTKHIQNDISIPLASISHINVQSSSSFTVFSEDLSYFTFAVTPSSTTTIDQIVNTVESFKNSTTDTCFAFYYQPEHPSLFKYDAIAEYRRLGITDDDPMYRLSIANASYQLCPTYPKLVCVAKSITDELLMQAASFRTKQRLPVVTWKLKPNRNALLRSSQPHLSFSGSSPDVKVLDVYADTSIDSILHVFDARPQLNALANMGKRGGWESNLIYPRVKVTFLCIENIHRVRSSFTHMRRHFGTDEQQMVKPHSMSWFHHIETLLSGSWQIANAVLEGKAVLVHCSDGWDRTAQLTSLAMVILDPYFRTLTGFATLIEKEWLSFGHQFAKRLGQDETRRRNYGDKQRSPIFIQFLDCVYQIMNQNPRAFQFSESLLQVLYHHCYSGAYGTFLYNCEKDRSAHCGVTRSVMDLVFMEFEAEHKNLKYDHKLEKLQVSYREESLEMWKVYGNRWRTSP